VNIIIYFGRRKFFPIWIGWTLLEN